MKHSNRTRRLIPVTFAILLLVAPCVWLERKYHQLTLNRAVIAAIKNCDAQEVDALLAAGADPNTRDTPVTHESIWQRIHDLIHPPPPDLSPTAMAVAIPQQGKENDPIPHILTALLSHGADPNMIVEYTLHLVVPGNKPASVDFIFRQTPVMVATTQHRTTCVRILLEHGANPSPKENELGTPLSWARGSDYKDIIKLLKSRGAKE